MVTRRKSPQGLEGFLLSGRSRRTSLAVIGKGTVILALEINEEVRVLPTGAGMGLACGVRMVVEKGKGEGGFFLLLSILGSLHT